MGADVTEWSDEYFANVFNRCIEVLIQARDRKVPWTRIGRVAYVRRELRDVESWLMVTVDQNTEIAGPVE